MAVEADFVLLGTGLAPLLAAQSLMRHGHAVLVLNPHHDFFREDSELCFEPVLPSRISDSVSLDALRLHRLERAREVLAPEFPGAIEEWNGVAAVESGSFRDPVAPFLRVRQWNWVTSQPDDLQLRLLDLGWAPVSFEGVPAARRFPGMNWQRLSDRTFHSVGVERLVDVDVDRYRNGVLEFVRSRVAPDLVRKQVSQLELLPGAVRFIQDGGAEQVQVRRGLWAFWTPALTAWLEKCCATIKQERFLPRAGVHSWEEWSLRSREPIDPTYVGLSDLAAAWAQIEGEPNGPRMDLNVLMPSPRTEGVASAESLSRLSVFVQQFLCWDRFRVRDLRTRSMLDVPSGRWFLPGAPVPTTVMSGCEGALVSVVDRVMKFVSAEVRDATLGS